jgi:hypothetical protein
MQHSLVYSKLAHDASSATDPQFNLLYSARSSLGYVASTWLKVCGVLDGSIWYLTVHWQLSPHVDFITPSPPLAIAFV